MSITFELRPIDPAEADRLRASWGHAPVCVADERPGYPCRQCLEDAEIGEELLLVSYDPFMIDSPTGWRARSFCIAFRGHRRPIGGPCRPN
jgi:Protein of unknown function (DUF1203)